MEKRVSSLKYQLLCLLPSLSADAQKSNNLDIKSRLKILRRIVLSKRSVTFCCDEIGVSREWFYKWGRRLVKAKNLSGLIQKSKKPHRSSSKTPKRVEKRIRHLRLLEPFSGCERISQDLKTFYNMNCPPTTVNKVLNRLKLISKKRQEKLTKRHLKRYRRESPGFMQMDFKYVPYKIQGKQFYQLSAIDHHSSWRWIKIYERKDQKSVIQFLDELIEECPFAIFQIQTDNDAAFTDKFTHGGVSGEHVVDLWCKMKKIEHKLIPVGQKELNGKVENSHKQDDREFFSQVHCLNGEALKLHSTLYNQRWNQRRSTKALGWLTPQETVFKSFVVHLALILYLSHKYQLKNTQILKRDIDLNPYLEIKETKPKRKTQTHKISRKDRYLQYLSWLEKKSS